MVSVCSWWKVRSRQVFLPFDMVNSFRMSHSRSQVRGDFWCHPILPETTLNFRLESLSIDMNTLQTSISVMGYGTIDGFPSCLVRSEGKVHLSSIALGEQQGTMKIA